MTADLQHFGPLGLRSIREGGEHVLELHGDLDVATAPPVEREFDTAVADPPQRMVLDLSDVKFMDSRGLRLLIHLRRKAEGQSYELVFRRPPENVQRLIVTAGIHPLLPWSD
jgi:anti-sigma B factor antagonist